MIISICLPCTRGLPDSIFLLFSLSFIIIAAFPTPPPPHTPPLLKRWSNWANRRWLLTHRQTHPSVQAVYLVGSWDNFSKTYSMERDIRRDHGQWRGCHSFKNIICDGDSGSSPRRDGGLKMGQTYYYYVSTPSATRPKAGRDHVSV